MSTPVTIAVVTDDGQTISRHFGRAKYFVIFTVMDGEITDHKQIEKSAHRHGRHGRGKPQSNVTLDAPVPEETQHGHNHDDMFAPLQEHGVTIVLTRGMGYGAHNGLSALGMQPIITDIADIESALSAYIDGSIVDHPEKLH